MERRHDPRRNHEVSRNRLRALGRCGWLCSLLGKGKVMSFRVGMKVVCVDVSPTELGRVPVELKLNGIYTIVGFGLPDCMGDVGLYLAEATPTKTDDLHSDAFISTRFRPAVER